MSEDYRICNRCIMDTTDPYIAFDRNGICNHCREYEERARRNLLDGQEGESRLKEIVHSIKLSGKGRKYDCILGLSGGTDSSFVAYHAHRLGLRSLAVHFDNGWNSEISIKNIENIVQRLDMDLYTYTVDWDEFKDLQLSFLKASVPDIEMLTDHAIMATIYKTAKKRGIRYVLGGTNFITEGIMPETWLFAKWDIGHIKAIQKRFGERIMGSFPSYGLWYLLIGRRHVQRLRYVEILNYIDYNKEEAKKVLQRDLGWKDYGGKHYESIFTKFYQAYILPTKFNIDKRKAHLSALICSGQITREQALEEIKKPLYTTKDLIEDKEYVLTKLGLNEEDFEAIMKLPIKSHLDYPNSQWIYRQVIGAYRFLSPVIRGIKREKNPF